MNDHTKALALTDDDRALARPHIPGWDDLTGTRRDELAAQWLRKEGRPTRAKVSITFGENGVATVDAPVDADKASYSVTIYEAFATKSGDFLASRLMEMAQFLAAHGSANSDQINGMLAFIGGCNPENEHQAGLATQMALTQFAANKALARAGSADDLEKFNAFMNAATKLSRTFVMQTEALAKLQRGGVQTVKHITVNEGGQAVVADTFHHGKGG